MPNPDDRTDEPEPDRRAIDAPTPADVAADPSTRTQPTGDAQAAANRENDPPA